MSQIPRRRFLYLLAGSSATLAVGPQLLRSAFDEAAGKASPPAGAAHPVTRTSWALGSNVTMTVLDAQPEVAAAALDAAFAELETVEQVMSIYRPESQVSRLNRDGVLRDPHPYLVHVLGQAAALSRRTAGAFDVTVQPLWETYWQAHANGRQPTTAEIATARRRVDWRRVDVAPGRIRLHGTGTAVTLNGIAQGFAADRATAALRRYGIEQALLDTGEFRAVGHGSDGDGWNVGIQHPRHEEALVSVANLAGRCLATSGDYATRFDDTFTSHHLLDPRNGQSAIDLASVSIVADTGLAADALSTAAFILGPEAGRQLIAATPGVDALFVTRDGRTWASREFPLHQTSIQQDRQTT